MPPSKWHMGRITQVLPARDKNDTTVRAVKVKTQTGEYVRSILKLALLLKESDNDSNNDDNQDSIQQAPVHININLVTLYNKMVQNTGN